MDSLKYDHTKEQVNIANDFPIMLNSLFTVIRLVRCDIPQVESCFSYTQNSSSILNIIKCKTESILELHYWVLVIYICYREID